MNTEQSFFWRILLIDDDEDDYLITRELLSEARGSKVDLCWASTYEQGRQYIASNRSQPFDAVLVDYDLGPKTGLELVREVDPKGCPFPLILLTGRGSYEVDVEAMQAGVSLYLTKNEVNALLLERCIRYAIELKHNEQLLQNRNARLQLLSDLSAQLLRCGDPVSLLDQVSRRLTELVEVDVFVHYHRAVDDAQTGEYLSLAAIGGYPEAVGRQIRRLAFGQAVCGTVAATQRPMIVQDVQQSTDERTQLIRKLGIGAYACHPLMIDGRLFGTLSFGSRTRSYLDEETVDLMRTICDLMAMAYERREKSLVLPAERVLFSEF